MPWLVIGGYIFLKTISGVLGREALVSLSPRKGDLACSFIFLQALKTSEANLSREPYGKLNAEGEAEAQGD